MNCKKILLIASEFPPNVGGIGNHAYNLALHLSKENFKITVVADVVNIGDNSLNDFRKNLPFNFIAVKRKKFVALTYAARIFKVIAQAKKSDVIICSGKFSLWTVNILKPFFSAKKYIAVLHGSELDLKNKRAKNLTDASLKKFEKVVAVSNYTKSFIPRGIAEKTLINVIPNGININEFTSFIKIHPEKISFSDELSLITIGSVTDRKGQENVIRAMPEILKYFPNIIYHVVGKPVVKDHLLKLVSLLRLNDKIIFHDIVERTELFLLLQQSSVKMMLSNHTSEGDFEGFGIAVLEANAFGKPAIGAVAGGTADAIENYKTGILVDVKDVNTVVNALKEIIKNYQTYSANALQWAYKHDWTIIIKKYIEVIEK